MIVGVITFYKTFAFYEEKREYDVIKGRIPEFSQEDIQLAFTINGEKGETFPSKNSRYFGKSVTCEKGVEASWNNETWGLDLINSNQQKRINCSIEFKTISEFSEAKIGDYVSYIPSKTEYDITNDLTGCTNEVDVSNGLDHQKLYPSELNLWRVIKKNSDGSIDLISEYVSSQIVYFRDKAGYKKYIGTLNTIAKQYETEGVTVGSRYMGYDGQTKEIVEDALLQIAPATWTEATTASNSPKGSLREAQGGGDVFNETDINLVKAACGTLQAYKVNKTDLASSYWIASRIFDLHDSNTWFLHVRRVNHLGKEDYGNLFIYDKGNINRSLAGNYIRPIVTLKSGIQVNSGNGSESSPWKVN